MSWVLIIWFVAAHSTNGWEVTAPAVVGRFETEAACLTALDRWHNGGHPLGSTIYSGTCLPTSLQPEPHYMTPDDLLRSYQR